MVAVEREERQLDVVVASGPTGAPPSERTVLAIGEAKAGETMTERHLHHLERGRSAIGPRAATAKLLLFASGFSNDLVAAAGRRPDIELIDLDRLYRGN